MEGDALAGLISAYGYWVLAPLAVAEGPIVTVIAGWLVALGLMQPLPVLACVVLGDLAGDLILYAAGRFVSLGRLPLVGRYLQLSRRRQVPLVRQFRSHGVRLLLLGKFTHAAGAAVLVAAGAARMDVMTFASVNLLASLPKSALLMVLGITMGAAHDRIATWLTWGPAALVAVMLAGVGVYFYRKRARKCQS